MGYIPISVAVPAEPSWFEGLAGLSHLLAKTTCLVLVCQSGHRALQLQTRFPTLWNLPVMALEGGIRAWQDLDLPMAGQAQRKKTPVLLKSSENIYRSLLSCFSAEWIESCLNQDQDPDNPKPVLDACFEAVGCAPTQTPLEMWPQVLSHVSVCSWRAGTSIGRIRDNLDNFQLALESLRASH